MQANTRATLDELEDVEWFTNVGVKDVQLATVVSSWDEAMERCASRVWKDLRLDAANQLAHRVLNASKQQYVLWNYHAREIKAYIEPLIDEKCRLVIARHQLPKSFVGAVRWDIGHLCMECEYADLVPPAFFTGLAYWYVAGHFPCGWEGDYPEGRIIVY